MDNTQSSLRHRCLTKLGWQFVEPKTLLIVFRDEQFHRLLEPGYHPPINIWRERYATRPISTELRFAHIDKIVVTTADHIQVKLDINILFRFDPRECPSPQTRASVVLYSDNQIEKIVTNITGNVVRSVCAAYKAIYLASGLYRQQVEGKLTAHLQRKLQSFGLLLVGQAPVSILTISLPLKIQQEWEEALQRQIYTSGVAEQSEEAAEANFRHELLANSDSIKLRIRQDNLFLQTEIPSPPNTIIPNGLKRHHNLNKAAN